MECVMKQKTVRNTRKLLDTFEEKAFDGDFVLPEYLPEIAAILACRLEPHVESHRLGGNRLSVDGVVYVHVLYVDQNRNRLFTYETSQPFTAAFTLDGICEPSAVYVEPILSYVNYRAIGPRRLDIRGAYRVYATVYDTTATELPVHTDEAGVCLQRCTTEQSLPAHRASKIFSINEILDIGGHSAEKIVRCAATATVSECKLLAGKAIVKGELFLHSLYEIKGSDEMAPSYASCDHTLLYSQMIDCIGLIDGEQAECNVSVLSCDVHVDVEEGTGVSLVVANLRLNAELQTWETCSLPYIADAYGLRCPALITAKEQAVTHLLGCQTKRFPLREEVQLPDGVKNVLDVWCDCATVGTSGNSLSYRMTVHLLATDESGTFSCYERAADFELPANTNGNVPSCRVRLTEYSYRVKEGGILELNVIAELFSRDMDAKTHTVVSALELDEAHPYPASSATVKMIFAESGESVWGIAKNAHTSAEAIQVENNLKDDALSEPSLLIIPLI